MVFWASVRVLQALLRRRRCLASSFRAQGSGISASRERRAYARVEASG